MIEIKTTEEIWDENTDHCDSDEMMNIPTYNPVDNDKKWVALKDIKEKLEWIKCCSDDPHIVMDEIDNLIEKMKRQIIMKDKKTNELCYKCGRDMIFFKDKIICPKCDTYE